jgi:hypothetical protein
MFDFYRTKEFVHTEIISASYNEKRIPFIPLHAICRLVRLGVHDVDTAEEIGSLLISAHNISINRWHKM